MEHITALEFHKATASNAGACVEVAFEGQVHVRNSRFPARVVDVPHARWQQLVAATQSSGRVNLAAWFPPKQYGDFAVTFTEAERAAFEQGVLAGEKPLVGPAA